MKSLILALCALTTVHATDILAISFLTPPATSANGRMTGYVGANVAGIFRNVICDDVTTTTNIPSGPITYYRSNVSNLVVTRFNDLSKYQAAAVLLSQYDAGFVGTLKEADYQYAIWGLFSGVAGEYGTSMSLRQAAIAQAALLPSTAGVFTNLRIYTPVFARGDQEFLGLNTSSVPEGSSLGMALIGLLAGVLKKFKQVDPRRCLNLWM